MQTITSCLLGTKVSLASWGKLPQRNQTSSTELQRMLGAQIVLERTHSQEHVASRLQQSNSSGKTCSATDGAGAGGGENV